MSRENSPKTKRVSVKISKTAQSAILEAQSAVKRAEAHVQSLLTGILVAEDYHEGAVIELRDGSLVIEVPLSPNGR